MASLSCPYVILAPARPAPSSLQPVATWLHQSQGARLGAALGLLPPPPPTISINVPRPHSIPLRPVSPIPRPSTVHMDTHTPHKPPASYQLSPGKSNLP